MSPVAILGWAAFAYFLLRSLHYLLAARVFLTCALREVEARPLERQQLDPAELPLLTLLDEDLAAAGFRLLGFGAVSSSLTFFDGPLVSAVFLHERIPAYAFVHRHLAPEYGMLVELDVRTLLVSGDEIVTSNTASSRAFDAPGMRVESVVGQSVEAIVARHAARVAAEHQASRASQRHTLEDALSLEEALSLVAGQMARSRLQFRERKWVVPTTDPRLDRFTLRGAVSLAMEAFRAVAAQKKAARTRPSAAPVLAGSPDGQTVTAAPAPPQPISDTDRTLRIDADLLAILQIAEHPESAPGPPWPLLSVIVATAALSFAAMATLWNASVAALILAVIAFHEAGHAIAMRLFGYRDIHVFFVPLLGAMTVGRAAVTSVRNRLSILLAGPVPGLWLALLLLGADASYGSSGMLRSLALALLILNGFNLLPLTPFDGGRVWEALTRPESVWRLVVHCASAAGLLALAAVLQDPIVAVLGALWAAIVPRYLASYRLRRAIAARLDVRTDFRGVARAALEVMMTTPRFASCRAGTRQATARVIARLFAESVATPADRRWGAIVYASAWVPVATALLLWMR